MPRNQRSKRKIQQKYATDRLQDAKADPKLPYKILTALPH